MRVKSRMGKARSKDPLTGLGRALFERSQQGILILGPRQRCVDVNPAGAAVLGYSREELLRLTLPDLASSDIVRQLDPRQLQLGTSRTLNCRLRHRNGRLLSLAVEAGKLAGGKAYFIINKPSPRRHGAAGQDRKHFEEIVNRSPAIAFIWRTVERWPVEYVSDNIRQLGYRAEDFYSGACTFAAIIHPQDLERVGSDVRAFTQAGVDEFTLQYRILTAAQETRWVDDHTWALRDARGRIVRCQGILLDITDRKQAEQALRESEARYRGLFEHSPVSLWEQDFSAIKQDMDRLRAEGVADWPAYFEGHPDLLVRYLGLIRVLDVNQAALKLYGAEDKPSLRRIGEVVDAREAPAMLRQALVAFTKGQSCFGAEGPQITLAGDPIHVFGNTIIVPGFEQTWSRVIVSNLDITERKRAEQALQASHDCLLRILDGLDADIYVADLKTYEVLFVNRHMRESFGENLVGKICWQVFRGESDRCSHCTNEGLLDKYGNPSGAVTWEGYNPITGRSYLNHDRAIKWLDGRLVRLQVAADITERKKVEETLRNNEERLRLITDNMADVVARLDRELKYAYVSPSAEKLYGYAPGELLGQPASAFVHPDDLENILAAASEARRAHAPGLSIEYRHRQTAGGYKWVESKVQLLYDELGEPAGSVISSRDITERKQVEEALRESRRMLEAVLDAIPVRVFWKDLNYRYIGCNRQFAVDSGFDSPEALIGRDDFEMSWRRREDLERYRADDRMVIQTGRPKLFYEDSQLTPEGEVTWYRASKIPLRDGSGNILGVLGTYEDITEYKRTETALKDSEEKFRSIVENSLAGIFMVDDAYRFIYVNDEMCRILGYPAEELSGMDFRRVLSAESEVLVTDHYLRRQRGEQLPNRYEMEVVRKDGGLREVEMIASVVKDSAGRIRSMGQLVDITDRRRVEQAVRESESRYRQLFEDNPHPMWVYDLKSLRFLEVNSAAVAKYGYSKEEFLSMTLADIRPPEDVAALYENLQLSQGVFQQSGPWRHRLKDGRVIYVDISSHTLTTAGAPARLVLAQDITERKQAEEALLESEERFRSLVRNSSDIVTVFTPEGIVTYQSPALRRVLGYEPDELIGRNGFDYVHPDDRQVALEAFKSILKPNSGPNTAEYRFRHADGSWVFIESVGSNHLEDPAIRGLIVNSRDISERKRAQEALRESEARFRRLADNIADGITIIEGGRAVYVNRRACEIFGYSREEFMNMSGFDLAAKEERERLQRLQEQVQQTGIPLDELEYWIVRKDGARRYIHNHYSAYYENGRVVGRFVATTDITDRKRAEQERETLISDLEAKNAELEGFTYTVSHDLKSPLVTIKGFLGYIERDAETGNLERLRGDTRRISIAVDRMELLLSDLLKLSRIGRFVNPSEIIPFDEVAREAVELAAGRIRDRGIAVDLHPRLPAVYGDRQRLVEALQNLIDNAARFMGDQHDPRIEIGQRGEENGSPVFYVQDNGMGIAPEHHEKVFGLFNKLDPAMDGTGVGLSIVKRVIELHGGRIWVESGPGKGSTFYFTLGKGASRP
jgi:PAS domain S-box-containing protein